MAGSPSLEVGDVKEGLSENCRAQTVWKGKKEKGSERWRGNAKEWYRERGREWRLVGSNAARRPKGVLKKRDE